VVTELTEGGECTEHSKSDEKSEAMEISIVLFSMASPTSAISVSARSRPDWDPNRYCIDFDGRLNPPSSALRNSLYVPCACERKSTSGPNIHRVP